MNNLFGSFDVSSAVRPRCTARSRSGRQARAHQRPRAVTRRPCGPLSSGAFEQPWQEAFRCQRDRLSRRNVVHCISGIAVLLRSDESVGFSDIKQFPDVPCQLAEAPKVRNFLCVSSHRIFRMRLVLPASHTLLAGGPDRSYPVESSKHLQRRSV